MATIEQALVSYLSGYAGLTALITGRVYNRRIPQGATIPCLTFFRVSTPHNHTMDTTGASTELVSPRFQFDAWASSPGTAKNIIDQLRAALNGKTGSIGTAPNNITIRAGLVEDEADEEPDVDSALYRRRSDFVIWQEE
jgi:hypothetical protein